MTNSTVLLPLNTHLLAELLETLSIKPLSSSCGELTNQLETEVIRAHLPMFHTTIEPISNPYSENSITLMAVSPNGKLLTLFKDSLWIGSIKSD